MDIENYCVQVGWSISQLSHEAKVDRNTITRAVKGIGIRRVKAAQIARALSRAAGRTITVEELKIQTI